MTLRYDAVSRISDYLESEDLEPTERNVSIAVGVDEDVQELWVEKYGKTLPHALSNRKKSLLMRDVRKKLEGEPVMGGGNGVGHRSATSSHDFEWNVVVAE